MLLKEGLCQLRFSVLDISSSKILDGDDPVVAIYLNILFFNLCVFYSSLVVLTAHVLQGALVASFATNVIIFYTLITTC